MGSVHSQTRGLELALKSATNSTRFMNASPTPGLHVVKVGVLTVATAGKVHVEAYRADSPPPRNKLTNLRVPGTLYRELVAPKDDVGTTEARKG